LIFSLSLWFPGTYVPGYFRASLRDFTPWFLIRTGYIG